MRVDVKFIGPVEVSRGVFADRGRGVRDGAYIRLDTGQVFHVAGARIDYWVDVPGA